MTDEPQPGSAPVPSPAAEYKAEAKPGERLHKYLASTGAGSRRECETFIEQGRVAVNGKVVTRMGVKVDPKTDVVTLDGEKVAAEEKVYYLLHKPAGFICTNSDDKGRPRVVDVVRDEKRRIYTVGRLDAESTGLILLTNDGEISNIVCHPRYRVEKTYQVVVKGEVTRDQLAKIEAGVWLAEGKASPARVRPVARNPRRNETLLEITLFEGRNREVRRVFARVGLPVRRLVRTRLGPLDLGTLAPGQSIRLSEKDLTFVREAQALYLANKEAWDAEVPKRPPKMAPPMRRRKNVQHRRPFGGGGRFGGPRPHGGGGGPFGPPRGPEGPRPDYGPRRYY